MEQIDSLVETTQETIKDSSPKPVKSEDKKPEEKNKGGRPKNQTYLDK